MESLNKLMWEEMGGPQKRNGLDEIYEAAKIRILIVRTNIGNGDGNNSARWGHVAVHVWLWKHQQELCTFEWTVCFDYFCIIYSLNIDWKIGLDINSSVLNCI